MRRENTLAFPKTAYMTSPLSGARGEGGGLDFMRAKTLLRSNFSTNTEHLPRRSAGKALLSRAPPRAQILHGYLSADQKGIDRSLLCPGAYKNQH